MAALLSATEAPRTVSAAKIILTLNAGSSSIKFALFQLGSGDPSAVVRGSIEGIATAPHLLATDASGVTLTEHRWESGLKLRHEDLLARLLNWIDEYLRGEAVAGVGHRIVHGGAKYSGPMRVTRPLMHALQALVPLAPLHQPHNLAAIQAAGTLRPHLPQVACFDTSFHHDEPSVATRLAIPRALASEGVRRYGFHGISYEYIARRLQELDPVLAAGRVIVAHLGNGASLCAMRAGHSVDTTMGFTPLDGLVMGTRCGALDAGVVLYLLQQKGMTADAVSRLLYEQSGLLGVSGISSDMRALLASGDPCALEAVELFVYRVARDVGALMSSLGGLDGLVFTAGIGENAIDIRSQICRRLAWIGCELDEAANTRHAPIISSQRSRLVVRVVATDEEKMIATHTRETLRC